MLLKLLVFLSCFFFFQGKVHLELKLNELITDNGSVCQQLVVQ